MTKEIPEYQKPTIISIEPNSEVEQAAMPIPLAAAAAIAAISWIAACTRAKRSRGRNSPYWDNRVKGPTLVTLKGLRED